MPQSARTDLKAFADEPAGAMPFLPFLMLAAAVALSG